MTTRIASCSCGDSEAHLVARRTTADGIAVKLWSDGGITGTWGRPIAKGVPVKCRRADAVRAGWLFVGEVELVDAKDSGRLYAAVRRALKSGGRPGDVRRFFHA